jgi:hypothetical protein
MVCSAFCWRAVSAAEPVANTPQKFLAVNHNTLHRATTKLEAGTVEAVRINPSSGSTSAITSDSGFVARVCVQVIYWGIVWPFLWHRLEVGGHWRPVLHSVQKYRKYQSWLQNPDEESACHGTIKER